MQTKFVKYAKYAKYELIMVGLIVLTFVFAFSKTIFDNKPISRFYQLGQRDSLFENELYANNKITKPENIWITQREAYDASVYQYFVPTHTFITNEIKAGQVPLWNPLVGCGAPFLADIETALVWPFRLALFFLDPIRSWNLLIICNLITYALGTYLLARISGLKQSFALYAALLSGFCPYIIFQSELIGSSSAMIPWVMSCFLLSFKKESSFLLKILAGFSCALMIVSGHPEPSFFGILSASLLYLSCFLFQTNNNSIKFRFSILVKALINISIIGTFAFLFSAPILLPFVELLKNSDCYKLGLTSHRAGVPLNSFFINLIHPAYGNSSSFLGILILPFLLFSLIEQESKNNLKTAFGYTFLISCFIMCQLGPLDWLMNLSFFSWFVPKYYLPSAIILIAIISSFGFESLVDVIAKNDKRKYLIFAAFCIFTIASLLAIKIFPSLLICQKQDEAWDILKISKNYWSKDLIILIATVIILYLTLYLKKYKTKICYLIIVLVSSISLAPISKSASPVKPLLSYPQNEAISFLVKEQKRFLTMGRHVFCPANNMAYNINNLVPVNVYHPSRFQKFMIAAGVSPEGVNQFFDNRLNKIINLAAIKYILTPLPILSRDELQTENIPLAKNSKIEWHAQASSQIKSILNLNSGILFLVKNNQELIGKLSFNVLSSKAKELAIQAVLLRNNEVIWFGDTKKLQYEFANDTNSNSQKLKNDNDYLNTEFDICVPLPKAKGSLDNFVVAIQIFDWKNYKYIAPVQTKEKNKNAENLIELCNFNLENSLINSALIHTQFITDKDRSFKLIKDYPKSIRIYENKESLDPAYFCQNIIESKNGGESLEKILSSTFKPGLEAVIENPPQIIKESVQNSKPLSLEFKRINANNIMINIDTNTPGWLILNENYYPGWQARIENSKKNTDSLNIYRANYLFQAIQIPSGKSKIFFQFRPTTFITGLAFMIFAILFSIIILYRLAKNNIKGAK